MALYKIAGSYEEFFEAVIEADTEELAQQIFYQNSGHMTTIDSNWVDIHVDDRFESLEELEENGLSIEFTMANYEPSGPRTAV